MADETAPDAVPVKAPKAKKPAPVAVSAVPQGEEVALPLKKGEQVTFANGIVYTAH